MFHSLQAWLFKVNLWTQILSSKKIPTCWFLQMPWHKWKIFCVMHLKVVLFGSEIKAKPNRFQLSKYTFKILCCDWIVRKHRKANDQKTSNDHLKRISFGFIFCVRYDLRIYLQIQSSMAYLKNRDNFCHHVKSKSQFSFSLFLVLSKFLRPIWNAS